MRISKNSSVNTVCEQGHVIVHYAHYHFCFFIYYIFFTINFFTFQLLTIVGVAVGDDID